MVNEYIINKQSSLFPFYYLCISESSNFPLWCTQINRKYFKLNAKKSGRQEDVRNSLVQANQTLLKPNQNSHSVYQCLINVKTCCIRLDSWVIQPVSSLNADAQLNIHADWRQPLCQFVFAIFYQLNFKFVQLW